MGILVYDEIWTREPRLMVPNQLPSGAVKPSGDMAADLFACYVMSHNNKWYIGGANTFVGTRDIGRYDLKLAGYSTSPAGPRQDPDGIGFPAPGGTTYCRLNHPNENAAALDVSYLSAHMRIRRDDLGNYRRLFSRGSDGATKSRYDAYLDGADNALYFDFYDAGSTLRAVSSGLVVPLGWSNISIVYDGATIAFTVNQASSVVSAAYGAIKNTAGNYFVIGAYLDLNTNQYYGVIAHSFFWSSPKSQAMMLALNKDPYQYLIPA